ncbi:MAG: hypothetical protein ACE5JG_05725, partial [Planctomycetota bacterium]
MSLNPKSGEPGSGRGGLSLERFAATLRADFRFAPLNVLVLVALLVTGLVVHLSLHPFSVAAVGIALGSAVALGMLIRLTQVWEVVVVLGVACCLIAYLALRPQSEVLLTALVVALLLAPSVQIAYQWERAVVLRFGRFRGLRKPGLFVILPVIDKVAQFVDQR